MPLKPIKPSKQRRNEQKRQHREQMPPPRQYPQPEQQAKWSPMG
jgi:hypothetical protein